MHTKFHVVSEANGCLVGFLLTAGQVSNYTGSAAL